MHHISRENRTSIGSFKMVTNLEFYSSQHPSRVLHEELLHRYQKALLPSWGTAWKGRIWLDLENEARISIKYNGDPSPVVWYSLSLFLPGSPKAYIYIYLLLLLLLLYIPNSSFI